MTPSTCVLASWSLTILFIISLPILWDLQSWVGFVVGLAIILIVAVLVAARGELSGDPWSGNEPRTFKMFLDDVLYVLFGPLLMVPGVIAVGIMIFPSVALVALWKSSSWGGIAILLLTALIVRIVIEIIQQKTESFQLLKNESFQFLMGMIEVGVVFLSFTLIIGVILILLAAVWKAFSWRAIAVFMVGVILLVCGIIKLDSK